MPDENKMPEDSDERAQKGGQSEKISLRNRKNVELALLDFALFIELL
jgi:hypothetical protein